MSVQFYTTWTHSPTSISNIGWHYRSANRCYTNRVTNALSFTTKCHHTISGRSNLPKTSSTRPNHWQHQRGCANKKPILKYLSFCRFPISHTTCQVPRGTKRQQLGRSYARRAPSVQKTTSMGTCTTA